MNSLKLRKKFRTEYFDPTDPQSAAMLGEVLTEMLEEYDGANREIVLVCIGTDRATGDALGPLVGNYILSRETYYHVAGTLEYPVHALNLKQTIQDIYNQYDNPLIIAVDASLGMPRDLGFVTISNGPIFPGKGVNKKLPAIGDISITGIVNLSGRSGINLLQNTRLYTVMQMSDCIGRALLHADSHMPSPL